MTVFTFSFAIAFLNCRAHPIKCALLWRARGTDGTASGGDTRECIIANNNWQHVAEMPMQMRRFHAPRSAVKCASHIMCNVWEGVCVCVCGSCVRYENCRINILWTGAVCVCACMRECASTQSGPMNTFGHNRIEPYRISRMRVVTWQSGDNLWVRFFCFILKSHSGLRLRFCGFWKIYFELYQLYLSWDANKCLSYNASYQLMCTGLFYLCTLL